MSRTKKKRITLDEYRAIPRIGTAKYRPWTRDELLLLLDPSVRINTVAERIGVGRSVIYAELERMRNHGVDVPSRRKKGPSQAPLHRGPRGPQQRLAERDAAIVEALHNGKSQREVAEEFSVSQQNVSLIWRRETGGYVTDDAHRFSWNPFEVSVLILHAGRTIHEIADMLGRTPLSVERKRDRLIEQGVIPRNRIHPDVSTRNRAIAIAVALGATLDDVSARWDLSLEAVRAAIKSDAETQRIHKYDMSDFTS